MKETARASEYNITPVRTPCIHRYEDAKQPLAGRLTLEATREDSVKIAACRLHLAESGCFVDYTYEVCLFLLTKTRVEGLPKYQSRVL